MTVRRNHTCTLSSRGGVAEYKERKKVMSTRFCLTYLKKDFDKTHSLNAVQRPCHYRKAATVTSKGKKYIYKRNKNIKWYDFSLRKARLVLVNKEFFWKIQ